MLPSLPAHVEVLQGRGMEASAKDQVCLWTPVFTQVKKSYNQKNLGAYHSFAALVSGHTLCEVLFYIIPHLLVTLNDEH